MPTGLDYDESFLEDESLAESEDDLEEFSVDEIRQAVLVGSDWTTETILSQIDKGNILLNPEFQRRDAWTRKRKSEFIESLILGLPVPQIVLAESKTHRGKFLILDGKQRLLSIRQFAAASQDQEYSQLKLAGLRIRRDLNGKTLQSLREELHSYDDLSAFENETIRTVVIRNWPNEAFLYHVFLRLNTGSVSLSPQELRQALHPGPFVKFVDEESQKSPALRSILRNDKPDFRMRDAELLVRHFAFSNFLDRYKGNLKTFLDDACKAMNDEWEDRHESLRSDLHEFEEAHKAITEVFGDNAYRKRSGNSYERRFNRAVFDVMMFAFRDPKVRNALLKAPGEVENAFVTLSQADSMFQSSLERTTKSIVATETRLRKWAEALNAQFDVNLQVPQMRNQGAE